VIPGDLVQIDPEALIEGHLEEQMTAAIPG
jgi:hypothetical protein